MPARVLGNHPSPPHPFGELLAAADGATDNDVPHRALSEKDGVRPAIATSIREIIVRHHASPEMLAQAEAHRAALTRLGFGPQHEALRRFPTNPTTRKGNLAEIVLAEYLAAAREVILPIYRLRYNPNVDQSMKGDDVLAFDLDAEPARILVGEAKFRATSSPASVREIVEGLLRSHKAGVPVSLQFVADRLFEQGQADLASRIYRCAILFAQGELRLDYVGLLLSDERSAERVKSETPNPPTRRLVMISLGVEDPDALVDDCYRGLE